MDCRDIDRALVEGGKIAQLQLVQDHLRSCDRCRAMARALDSSRLPSRNEAAPSPERLRQIEQSIASDLRAVRPMWPLGYFFAAFAGIFFLIVAFGAYRMGTFAISVMSPLQAAAILCALAASAGLLAYSLVHQMSPGSRHRISPRLLPAGIIVLLLLLTAGLFQIQHDPKFWAHGWFCLSAGTPFALFAAVPFWFLLRRGAILSPRITGATTGLLAGLVGTSVLEIHCPNLDVLHVLTWHLGVALLGAMTGLGIGFLGELSARRR